MVIGSISWLLPSTEPIVLRTQTIKRMFSEISEDELVNVWYSSQSKTEVKKRLNVTNFGSKEKRLKELIKKYKLPSFHLKKVQSLSKDEISEALKDPNVKTLKQLCVKLKIAKKIHNIALKKRIVSEELNVPERLYKSIYGTNIKPWTYPRPYFIKRNKQIPTTCPQCNFVATIPRQIQIHHLSSKSQNNSQEKFKGSSLKKTKDYNVASNLQTICANYHSLEHHTRGSFEKNTCGLWLLKKPTNLLYKNPLEMFKVNCPHTYTLQKKYFI